MHVVSTVNCDTAAAYTYHPSNVPLPQTGIVFRNVFLKLNRILTHSTKISFLNSIMPGVIISMKDIFECDDSSSEIPSKSFPCISYSDLWQPVIERLISSNQMQVLQL